MQQTTSTGRRRAARLTTALAATLAAGALALVPATASATPTTQHVTHPDSDYLGSTVAAHEPTRHVARPRLADGTPGIDVSNHQGTIDWAAVATQNRFAYMKATEGTTFVDPTFGANYNGSFGAGLVRGAYHFGLPDVSNGATQAQYFVAHGGGWTRDGKTLPPMLDIEYNPYGATCYGLAPAAMSQWIADFSNTVQQLTGRFPTIYSTRDWWDTCTGANANFAGANPLMVASYNSSAGQLPAGWGTYTIWQYSSTGKVPGINGNVDVDTFNGAEDRLVALANG